MRQDLKNETSYAFSVGILQWGPHIGCKFCTANAVPSYEYELKAKGKVVSVLLLTKH